LRAFAKCRHVNHSKIRTSAVTGTALVARLARYGYVTRLSLFCFDLAATPISVSVKMPIPWYKSVSPVVSSKGHVCARSVTVGAEILMTWRVPRVCAGPIEPVSKGAIVSVAWRVPRVCARPVEPVSKGAMVSVVWRVPRVCARPVEPVSKGAMVSVVWRVPRVCAGPVEPVSKGTIVSEAWRECISKGRSVIHRERRPAPAAHCHRCAAESPHESTSLSRRSCHDRETHTCRCYSGALSNVQHALSPAEMFPLSRCLLIQRRSLAFSALRQIVSVAQLTAAR
jgi:hypothetical protein